MKTIFIISILLSILVSCKKADTCKTCIQNLTSVADPPAAPYPLAETDTLVLCGDSLDYFEDHLRYHYIQGGSTTITITVVTTCH